MTKVLLVEDSRTARSYVEAILRGAEDIELLPSATDGAAGVALALQQKPDVILMDLELPVLDGIAAIREIMAQAPCPIVVLSGQLAEPERDRTFESFQAGAVDVLEKPRGIADEEIARFGERLLRVVRVMRSARVLRRTRASAARSLSPVREGRADAVLIGASTGGPLVVRRILAGIPAPFPLPILICQHIVPGFEHGFATWLEATGHRVKVVGPGEQAQAGIVHVARADRHLGLRGRELLLLPREQGRPAPSADVLFEAAASSFGARCVALLLTGMGEDGKQGMLALRQRGALTVTQTAATCVIDGMPGSARAAGAAQHDLSPPEMCELLCQVVGAPVRVEGKPA